MTENKKVARPGSPANSKAKPVIIRRTYRFAPKLAHFGEGNPCAGFCELALVNIQLRKQRLGINPVIVRQALAYQPRDSRQSCWFIKHTGAN